jgi:hypothetical protein
MTVTRQNKSKHIKIEFNYQKKIEKQYNSQ